MGPSAMPAGLAAIATVTNPHRASSVHHVAVLCVMLQTRPFISFGWLFLLVVCLLACLLACLLVAAVQVHAADE